MAASDVVSWLVNTRMVPTRDTAVVLCRKMTDRGLLLPLNNNTKEFHDNSILWKIRVQNCDVIFRAWLTLPFLDSTWMCWGTGTSETATILADDRRQTARCTASVGNWERDNCTKSVSACFILKREFHCGSDDTRAKSTTNASLVSPFHQSLRDEWTDYRDHIGSDVVDWMMSNLPIKSRREGVELGKRLMAANYFTFIDAEGAQPFKDRKIFFCLRVSVPPLFALIKPG